MTFAIGFCNLEWLPLLLARVTISGTKLVRVVNLGSKWPPRIVNCCPEVPRSMAGLCGQQSVQKRLDLMNRNIGPTVACFV